MGRRYGAVTPRYACTGMLSCSMPKKRFNAFMLYVFLFTNYLDFSVMEIFWPMQMSVYQGISAYAYTTMRNFSCCLYIRFCSSST